MNPSTLRRNPEGTARLVRWLGGYTRAGRALGLHRNVLRYAAEPGYRERVRETNAEANPANAPRTPEERAERNAYQRARYAPVVHLAKPGQRVGWCGRPVQATEGRACKVCVRVACSAP